MTLRMSGSVFAILLCGAIVLPPLPTSAQTFQNTNPFSITIRPKYPAPYERAIITPTSGSVDLANASMTVTADGKQVYQGNPQPVGITLGDVGVSTNIKITVTSNGTPYSQNFSIRPQDVMVIAEPLSSAPALYPGKPLIPLEGKVRVVAVANMKGADGKTIPANLLSYTWEIDGATIASASGIGRSSFIVASPLQYRESTVSVTVRDQAGTVQSGASLSLAPKQPIVRIYKNDPLLGILFDHALPNTYTITSSEASFYGAPYSFSLSSGLPTLRWFLNGTVAQTGNLLTLRPTGSGKGSASLSLLASGGESITATTNLSVSFGTASGGGFFGL